MNEVCMNSHLTNSREILEFCKYKYSLIHIMFHVGYGHGQSKLFKLKSFATINFYVHNPTLTTATLLHI